MKQKFHKKLILCLKTTIVFTMLTILPVACAPKVELGEVNARKEFLSSIGAPEMGPLMDVLFKAYKLETPNLYKSEHWTHKTDTMAIGALMFEKADLAPILREFTRAELAPYAHQFHGDMMHKPFRVPIAVFGGDLAYIAVNRRPDAPLTSQIEGFLAFALSPKGQDLVRKLDGFSPLSESQILFQSKRIQGFVPVLDPALKPYKPSTEISGEIVSVGSDGMKALMDRWQRKFHKLHPQVTRGERWEHFGTLNGFHALLASETDLAPMGRELWPEELASYKSVYGSNSKPLEIHVARGGFNTPQRTTAQAIFVDQSNPLNEISFSQLRGIFSEEASISNWGQLGLKGEWANRPISLFVPPLAEPNSMSMKLKLFPTLAWNDNVNEGSVKQTSMSIEANIGSIGFGGFEDSTPKLKLLRVSNENGSGYVEGTNSTASSGLYPLTRYMNIRLVRKPNEDMKPQVKEFLLYILSRDGQADIRYSGYAPLTAKEVEIELAKIME